ncbi:MAG: acyltransferase [Labilithrix sp.]|nr:acyltransferase [Labilithrix sp.]
MLKSIETLSDPKRIPGVDVLRGIAVIAVVLFHFGVLPYGYIGVDLFFVVSGFLVGRPLARTVIQGKRPLVGRFIITRGFKIWPSYYAFIGLGTLMATALYSQTHPDQIITWSHAPRYLLFFQNYRGTPHWSFDHVWSLCVEEHFYVLLPVSALVAFRLFGGGSRTIARVAVAGILAGVIAKVAGHRIGFETHAATHNRVDALSWGLLLAIAHEADWRLLRRIERSRWTPFVGGSIVAVAVLLHAVDASPLFAAIGFHSVLPVGIVLLLAWARTLRTGPRSVRFVAYYSYNLYLWHAPLVFALRDRFGSGALGLLLYLSAAMTIAIAATALVEEPCLRLRGRLLGASPG